MFWAEKMCLLNTCRRSINCHIPKNSRLTSYTGILLFCRVKCESKLFGVVVTRQQCTYKCNTKALSCNHCYSGKAVRIAYSECASVALFIQHAKRMRHIILLSVACLAVPYFSILSHSTIFGKKKKLLNLNYVF
jgi:hypothetical protein